MSPAVFFSLGVVGAGGGKNCTRAKTGLPPPPDREIFRGQGASNFSHRGGEGGVIKILQEQKSGNLGFLRGIYFVLRFPVMVLRGRD